MARDLELGVTWDDLVLPEAPAHPRTFARLTEELGLSGSAARVLASLSRDA